MNVQKFFQQCSDKHDMIFIYSLALKDILNYMYTDKSSSPWKTFLNFVPTVKINSPLWTSWCICKLRYTIKANKVILQIFNNFLLHAHLKLENVGLFRGSVRIAEVAILFWWHPAIFYCITVTDFFIGIETEQVHPA